VNVIPNTANADEFGTEVTADGRKISMHPWPHVRIKPWLAILCAKDDVKNDFAQRLGHDIDDVLNRCRSESRFQRWWIFFTSRNLGRCPRLGMTPRLWR
jgi:hypothetical protein